WHERLRQATVNRSHGGSNPSAPTTFRRVIPDLKHISLLLVIEITQFLPTTSRAIWEGIHQTESPPASFVDQFLSSALKKDSNFNNMFKGFSEKLRTKLEEFNQSSEQFLFNKKLGDAIIANGGTISNPTSIKFVNFREKDENGNYVSELPPRLKADGTRNYNNMVDVENTKKEALEKAVLKAKNDAFKEINKTISEIKEFDRVIEAIKQGKERFDNYKKEISKEIIKYAKNKGNKILVDKHCEVIKERVDKLVASKNSGNNTSQTETNEANSEETEETTNPRTNNDNNNNSNREQGRTNNNAENLKKVKIQKLKELFELSGFLEEDEINSYKDKLLSHIQQKRKDKKVAEEVNENLHKAQDPNATIQDKKNALGELDKNEGEQAYEEKKEQIKEAKTEVAKVNPNEYRNKVISSLDKKLVDNELKEKDLDNQAQQEIKDLRVGKELEPNQLVEIEIKLTEKIGQIGAKKKMDDLASGVEKAEQLLKNLENISQNTSTSQSPDFKIVIGIGVILVVNAFTDSLLKDLIVCLVESQGELYDPCCGLGSFLLKAKAKDETLKISGNDIDSNLQVPFPITFGDYLASEKQNYVLAPLRYEFDPAKKPLTEEEKQEIDEKIKTTQKELYMLITELDEATNIYREQVKKMDADPDYLLKKDLAFEGGVNLD
ncbi:9512_t:CDS:10, partial [Ambispora leptoticha]